MNLFTNPAFRGRVLLGFLLVWLGLVFGHYFPLKTAFDLSFLSTVVSTFSQSDLSKLAGNWLNFLKNFFCAVAVGFVLWRLGRNLLRWIKLEETGIALRFCMEIAFGIVGVNILWLGLGLNGLWFDPLLWTIAVVLMGWAFWDFSRNFLKIQKFPKLPKPGRFFLLLGILGALGLALDILQGVAPDVYFDALVYHLSTLQFWKFHHGIADFYTNLYSYFPFGAELYFGNGFFFAGSEVAKLLNAFSAGLCGLAAAGWAAKETGADRGLLVWAMVLTLPLVSATVWTTQNDVFLAFLLVLFFYALVRWLQGPKNGPWALAAGLLGGAALTVKYTAVVGVAAGLFVTAFSFRTEAFKRTKSRGWILIFFLVAFSITPWLLKNIVFTGNGVYPYFSSVFGGKALPAENMKALMGDHEAVWNGSFSLGTWIARVLGKDMDKTIAPLLFGFLPFLFLGGKRRPITRYLLLLSALLLLSGFLISHQLRLLIPALILSFVAMALVLGDTRRKEATPFWGGVATIFAILSLLSLGRLSANYYQTDHLWLGETSQYEYLTKAPQTQSYFWMARAVDRFVSGQVLVLGDARGLYYTNPVLTNSVFDEQVFQKLARTEKDGDGIRKKLKEMGVDAVVISGDEEKRLSAQNPFYVLDAAGEGKWREFLQRWTDPMFWDGNCCLYRVRSTPAGSRPAAPDFLKVFETNP